MKFRHTDALPFARLWTERNHESIEDTRSFWNERAEEFNQITNANGERDELVSWLEAQGALLPHFRVLDLGCGAGRFTLAFGPKVESITALDISPNMVALARENAKGAGLSNIRFSVRPWETVDLDQAGYRNGFDLSFAHMSPAVCSEDTLLKFHHSSKQYCFLSGFIERDDMLERDLAGELFPALPWHSDGGGIYFAFNVLWQHRIYPELRRRNTTWTNQWDLAKALSHYKKTFRQSYYPPRDDLDTALESCLRRRRKDSLVSRHVRAQKAWLFWSK